MRTGIVAASLAALLTGYGLDARQQAPPDGKSWVGHTPPGVRDPNLPPDETAAKEQLAKSPRRAEWVDISVGTGPTLKTFVVHPERQPKSGVGVVLVVHDQLGMSEWIRGMADQLGKHGFLTMVPDLLSGKGPNGGGTETLGAKAAQAVEALTIDEVVVQLDAVREYGLKLPNANGRAVAVGFSWGGAMTFRYALRQPRLNGAVAFSGTIPTEPAAYENARVQILGLYGSADTRATANIDLAEFVLGNLFTSHVYLDADDRFARDQTGQNGRNLKALTWAWPETVSFLSRTTSGGGFGGA